MTNYIASLNGKIIGKRTTVARTYTHAVVVRRVEAHARDWAYHYVATKTDRSNFEYYLAVAEGRRPADQENVVAASVKVDGGYGAYIARVQEKHIAQFEAAKANGNFEPAVASWAGRLDLAHKASAQWKGPAYELVAIVPAEIAPTKARKAQVA